MKLIFLILLEFLLSLIFTKPVFAKPIINEVYPKPNSEENEWVEIFNDSTELIDLSGWILMDEISAPSIIFQFDENLDTWKIEPLEFLVIEIENNKLNNAADGLKLIDPQHEIIDQFNYVNSELEKSFSLIMMNNQLSNILSVPSKGLPNPPIENPENIESEVILDETQTSDEKVLEEYPSLIIYEVMSCPEENISEWVKIMNPNNETVGLDHWMLKDSANNQVILGSSEEIPGQSFIIIYLTNSILNNSGDLLILLDPNHNVADSLEFGQCSPGVPISSANNSKENDASPPEFTSTTELLPKDNQIDDVLQKEAPITLTESVSNLKKINALLTISNSDKSSTAKNSNYISKQVIIKDNSLSKTAVISVIIGGATLASSGLFFINHEKN